MVNVHVDISDVTRNYAYDGGVTTQVVGPGGGTVQFVMSYNFVGGNITAGDTYQLHTYLTPENNTQVYGAGNDYLHSISTQYYAVTVGSAAPTNATYPGLIYNAISAYVAPSTIPANGYLTGVWSTRPTVPTRSTFTLRSRTPPSRTCWLEDRRRSCLPLRTAPCSSHCPLSRAST